MVSCHIYWIVARIILHISAVTIVTDDGMVAFAVLQVARRENYTSTFCVCVGGEISRRRGIGGTHFSRAV